MAPPPWPVCGSSGLAGRRDKARRGATLLEGYPTNPRGTTADAFLYTGTGGAFSRAGFEVAARPSKTALIVRREL